MAAWNPRIPESWAQLLGMVHVPMFGPVRAPTYPGNHSVIVDGRYSGFSLSIGDADSLASSKSPIEWSWSANVRHSVIVDADRSIFLIRRWDLPDHVEQYEMPDAARARLLPTRFQTVEQSEIPTVIERSINAFRFVRNSISAAGGTDNDAIRAFNTLLLWADLLRHTSQVPSDDFTLDSAVAYLAEKKLTSYDPDDFSLNVRKYPLSEAVDMLLHGSHGSYLLDADLLVRHAGGTLFQEAHLEIDATSHQQQTLLFPLWVSDEPVEGTPKHDAHFTPPSLARLLIEVALQELIKTKSGLPQSISALDPACGSGVFFIELIREMTAKHEVASLDLHGFDNTTVSRIMSEFSVQRTMDEYAPGAVNFQVFQGDSLSMDKWGEPDIIMMNPPFTSWTSLSESQRSIVQKTLGDWYSGNSDTSIAFVAKAIRSLRPGSILATVVPAPFLESKAAEKIRRAIFESKDISVHLIGRIRGYGFFRNALIEPAFIVLSRSPRDDNSTIRCMFAEAGSEDHAIRALRREPVGNIEGHGYEVFSEKHDVLSQPSWMPRPQRGMRLLRRIESGPMVTTVGELFDTNLGVRVGLKNAFLLTSASLRQLAPTAAEKKYFRPTADTIKDSRIIEESYIFYPYSSEGRLLIETETELSRRLPTFYHENLLPFKDTLTDRKSLRKRKWWELVEPRPTWQGKKQPKIVTPAFGQRGNFAFDSDGRFVVVQGVAWIPRSDAFENDDLPWAFVCVLNSEPFERLVSFLCPKVAGGQFELYAKYISQVPLPDLRIADPAIVNELAMIGKRMAHSHPIDDSYLSTLVCELFGVPVLEMKRSLPLTEEERLKLRFSELADQWRESRGPTSAARMARLPAYEQIVTIGEPVIPFILAELERKPDHWFIALHAITGADPVPRESRGRIEEMAAAWLKWGRDNGISW